MSWGAPTVGGSPLLAGAMDTGIGRHVPTLIQYRPGCRYEVSYRSGHKVHNGRMLGRQRYRHTHRSRHFHPGPPVVGGASANIPPFAVNEAEQSTWHSAFNTALYQLSCEYYQWLLR